MLFAYSLADNGRLRQLPPDADLAEAIWVDLYRPQPAQVERARTLGIDVPTLADMEEIEISNRLYHEADADYMTAVIPGQTPTREQTAGPVTFILNRSRLVTVRHHAPRPFETFPERADRSAAGCASADRLFLGLVEEIVARQADLLEGMGKVLDDTAKGVFGGETAKRPEVLQAALERIGREGEVLARVRLGLLTMERTLSYYGQGVHLRFESEDLRQVVKGAMRDIQALEVHADFLSNRVGLITDATLGLIDLAQNATVRIVSVVAALFLPPTLIASIYGMNFAHMPELDSAWGYPGAILLMVASALLTYLYFRWKHWL
jgi:magnesium transporter